MDGLREGIHRRVSGPPPPAKKKNTNAELERIAKNREERRLKAAQDKEAREKHQKRLEDMGCPGDVDFQLMIEDFRRTKKLIRQHSPPGDSKICICIRKRPINQKEVAVRDYDSVTNWNPQVLVHYCKLKVDGITKYLDNASFEFDHTFGEDDDTYDIYKYTCAPLVPFTVGGGRATVFAYGQTGSGKTYTMQGIQEYVTRDLFEAMAAHPRGARLQVSVAFFEIYGGRCQDLLNRRHRLQVREDGQGEVQIVDLQEMPCEDAAALEAYVQRGNRNRTTHATEKNDVSSRSHAVCQIALREVGSGRLQGKISLIDLAGSERGADTKSHNRQRRMESAEINKSLLALKECIRALDSNDTHIPYRASKLTLVLKDSFTNKSSARTVMIATVAPNASSADHTINTLRYADRVKEKKVGGRAGQRMPVVERAGGGGGGGGGAKGEGDEDDDGGAPSRAADARAQLAEAKANGAGAEGGPRGAWAKGGGGGGPTGIPLPGGGGGGGGRRGPARGGGAGAKGERSPRGGAAAAAAAAAAPRGGSPLALGDLRARSQEEDDIDYLHQSLRLRGEEPGGGGGAGGCGGGGAGGGGGGGADGSAELEEMHRTVQRVFEEEEALLNRHMTVIQETAELLTEEGRLLQGIQGDEVVDYDIDAYAARLEEILVRKQEITSGLQRQLQRFRKHLQDEERVSQRIKAMNL